MAFSHGKIVARFISAREKHIQHADLCLLLNIHNIETAINHANGSGQRATYNICVTLL